MKRIPVFLGLILVASAVWLQITSLPDIRLWITDLENTAYDFQLRTKLMARPKALETVIAIVDIDDKSLAAEGRWPWARSKLAALADKIRENGAVVIAFDILFSESEENIANIVLDKLNENNLTPPPTMRSLIEKIEPYFNNDAKFAESLKQIDSILAITFTPYLSTQGMIPKPLLMLSTPDEKQLAFIIPRGIIGNIPVLQKEAKGTGFINVFADEDGTIRRVPLLIRYQNGLYPSLALETARLYLLSNVQLVSAKYGHNSRLEGIKIGNQIIPTDAKGQVIIPYRGKSFTFPYYSATDVLHGKIPRDVFSGKIVFVGTSAIGLGDIKPTSVQNIFPGVEIHATVTDGILKNNFSINPDWAMGAQAAFIVFIGIIFSFLFTYLGPRTLTLLIITIPCLLILANTWLWETTGILLSVLIPVLLTILLGMLNMVYGYFFETRRRERIKEMFGQYVPGQHIDEMLRSSGDYGLYGEDRDMTVLFADIRNFTTMSEKLSATQLKELLNEIFTPMTEIIFNHHGTIDKYVGDMIMAFWGAPLKDSKHAKKSLTSALDMQKKLRELRPILVAKGWPEIYMGIGLNSGMMSVGDMGSSFRRNYTVLGDTVNLGSRIEGLTKHYGVDIMTSEHTQKNQTQFVFRPLDRVKVKGKKEGVDIYEVVCHHAELTESLKYEIDMNKAALNYYYEQQWTDAKNLFTQLHEAHPQTKLYLLYLQRINEFEQQPPPADWDGIYTHTVK